jgi:hypothetical protein
LHEAKQEDLDHRSADPAGAAESISTVGTIVFLAPKTVGIKVPSIDPQFSIDATLCGNQYLCFTPSVANVLGYIDCRRDGLSVVGKMTLDPPLSLDHPFVAGPENINLQYALVLEAQIVMQPGSRRVFG